MTNPTTNPAAPVAAAATSPEAPKVKAKKVALRAVHGLLVHPFLKPEVRFTPDTLVKAEIDAWVKVQLEAGKLEEDKDD